VIKVPEDIEAQFAEQAFRFPAAGIIINLCKCLFVSALQRCQQNIAMMGLALLDLTCCLQQFR
jgi:hypothetical protein